jgi:hypothetical protein
MDRGTHRLLPEESGRGLVVPKERELNPARITKGLLSRTTVTLFHWEHLSATMSQAARSAATPSPESPAILWNNLQAQTRPEPNQVQVPFAWKPPDLKQGGAWYKERIANLQKAAESFKIPASIIDKGVLALDIHQRNYNAKGPKAKRLQLLWWEFPAKH